MTFGTCMFCHSPMERRMVEVTAFGDPQPRYLDAGWMRCFWCGVSHAMVSVPCAPMGPVQGPAVPTPDEITHGALDGLSWLQ